MKISIAFFLGVITSFALLGQANIQRIYGGDGDERGHAIIRSRDGGYVLAGQSNSFGAGGYDICILKISDDGTIIWQKTFGGTDNETGVSIAMKQVRDGGYIVTGSSGSFGLTSNDLYVFKLDLDGNLLWDFTYDSGPTGNGADHGRGLLICKNDDILVLGTDDSHSFDANEGLLLRLSKDGVLIWKKIYGGDGNDHLHEAIELPGGNLLVCGSSQSFGPGNTAGYLLKLTPGGNVLWSRTYGGNGIEGFNACDTTPDFKLVTTGLSTSYGNGSTDIVLSVIDTFGMVQWTRILSGGDDERGTAVRSLEDNSGYLLSAYTESYGSGSRDIMVIETSLNGATIWSRSFGTSGYEGFDPWSNCGLTLADGGSFAITGWSDNLSQEGEDILFVKCNDSGDAFCTEEIISSNSRVLSVSNASTLTNNVGSYKAVSSTVGFSLLQETELCYCIPDSICSPCIEFDFSIVSGGEINCINDSVQLTTLGVPSQPNLRYTWKDSANVLLSEAITLNVIAGGLYILQLTDTVNGCQSIDSLLVVENRMVPTAIAGQDQLLTCYNASVLLQGNENFPFNNLEFEWTGPAGAFESDSLEKDVSVVLPGQYILFATDTTNGCSASDTLYVVLDREVPHADAGPPVILDCTNVSDTLSAVLSSIGMEFSYSWDGPGLENAMGLFVIIQAPGVYLLTVTNSVNGCQAVDSVEVTSLNAISAFVTTDDPICFGDNTGMITFSSSGGMPPYQYAIDEMNFQQSATFGGLSSGTYSVIIRDSEGCEWDSVVILIDGINISIDLGPDLILESNEIFVLEPSIQSTGPLDSLSWSPSQFLSCINCLNPSISSPQPDSFEISSIVFSTSCFDTDTLLIIIHDTYSVFIPNVFSPNGDNINDYFTIYTNDRLGEILELNIYDRWGEHLFKSTNIPPNNPSSGWNGHFKGRKMNPGVYVYTAQVKFNDGSVQSLSGDITLVR